MPCYTGPKLALCFHQTTRRTPSFFCTWEKYECKAMVEMDTHRNRQPHGPSTAAPLNQVCLHSECGEERLLNLTTLWAPSPSLVQDLRLSPIIRNQDRGFSPAPSNCNSGSQPCTLLPALNAICSLTAWLEIFCVGE